MSAIDVKKALAAIAIGKVQEAHQNYFWYSSECGAAAKATAINSTVLARLNRTEEWMMGNAMPINREWLLQLCLWHRHKGGKIKVPVLALKYTLLDEWRREGGDWTRRMDEYTEGLALDAYREHKGKAPVR